MNGGRGLFDPERAMTVFGTLALLFRLTVELIRYIRIAKRAAKRRRSRR